MAPKIIPFSFGDEAVMAGSATQVTCLASEGDLPMDVQWHFRGSNVSSLGLGMSTTRVGSRTNLLVIDTVSPENGGLYTCRASNAAGSADYSAELLVQGTSIFKFRPHFLIDQNLTEMRDPPVAKPLNFN